MRRVPQKSKRHSENILRLAPLYITCHSDRMDETKQRTSDEITIGQAAELLGIHRETVRRRARAGYLPHRATPYGLVFRRSVLERMLADGWKPWPMGRPKKG